MKLEEYGSGREPSKQRAEHHPAVDAEQETLRRRARLLAHALPDTTDAADGQDYFCFRVGETRLLLSCAQVVYSFQLREEYRLPGMPPAVPGVLHFRGELIAVVDLRSLLRIESVDPVLVTVVAGDGNTIGLLADEILETQRLPEQNICPVPAHFREEEQRFVKAVTPNLGMLLDLPGICQFLRTMPAC